MRPNLRPFLAFLDVLFDVPSPPDRKTPVFGLLRIIVQDIDVALKITDCDQFLMAVAIDIRQTEPAVGSVLVITEFAFLASGSAFENHHTVMRCHANLRNTIAIEVMDDIEGLKNR